MNPHEVDAQNLAKPCSLKPHPVNGFRVFSTPPSVNPKCSCHFDVPSQRHAPVIQKISSHIKSQENGKTLSSNFQEKKKTIETLRSSPMGRELPKLESEFILASGPRSKRLFYLQRVQKTGRYLVRIDGLLDP